MRIFMTGATGFIGRALVQRLARDGHELAAWVRDPPRARSALGADIELISSQSGESGLRGAVAQADAVINLAGASVLGGRWTARRRRALVESRVGLTERLVRAMGSAPRPAAVLISASAIGYYGDRGDQLVDEQSAPGEGFLAELTLAWEAAAVAAESLGTRVVLPRIGVVLGRDGGALAEQLPLFRWGLGARLGSGRQFLSWIHRDDLLELIAAALVDQRLSGPVNATAPDAVTNAHFTQALARTVGRRAFLVVPSLILRAALGAGASVLLGGQRVRPTALESIGFQHRYATIDAALEACTSTA